MKVVPHNKQKVKVKLMKNICVNNRVLILFMVLICFFSCKEDRSVEQNTEKIDEFRKIKLSSYPTSTNLKENFNKIYLIKSIENNVDLYYPADGIFKFYDKEMAKVNFKPFVEDYYKSRDRNWSTYVDGTMKGDPYVAVCKTSWANNDKTKRATLVLKYYWYNKNNTRIILNNNKDLNVHFRIQPFYVEPPQKGVTH